MLREFRLWQALYACFYSKALYRDVFLRWTGLGFSLQFLLHVILVTLLLIAVIAIVETRVIGNPDTEATMNELVDQVSEQLPVLHWNDGILSADVEQPYSITFAEDGESRLFIIIDETGEISDLRDSEAMILLNAEAVHFKKDSGEYETRFWSEFTDDGLFTDYTLDAQGAQALGHQAIQWVLDNRVWLYAAFGAFFWAMLLLGLFIWRVIQMIFFGLIFKAIAAFSRQPLDFEIAMRLSAVTLIPAIWISLLCVFLGVTLHPLLFIAITVAYSVYAWQAIRAI